MLPNLISLIRVGLVFLTIWMFTLGFYQRISATILTIIVIYMDSLDGYIARKLNIASDFGALLDIAGDRIVESAYWIFFAWKGLFSYWIPVIVVTRGFLTDLIRSAAFADGKTPFGEKSHLRSKIARFICASRFSRALYGSAKVVAFVWLGGYLTILAGNQNYAWGIPDSTLNLILLIGKILVYITVVMCVVRGIPVIWESRNLLLAKKYPWKSRDL
jgi:CDP-diacylglycerol--glycerol-3-phosphate 3-phosphatidyltransferase